ncbi:MAG TPA: glutamine--fructose-6-phosphate transaminase (isomerizing) [Thermoleophilaceae bacterium]|jgi:glucosamine--fructose-6-phosphate aminotransferase (isomerizing)|nr:glutamine--fructose-6-phosphate transaminase (isomerizing) [Thermoleophilaceae bacterium]
MCGIIGYVGSRECRDLLLEGLQRLEYRGYDSAGLSLVTNGAVGSVHAVGNLQNLRDALARSNGHLKGSTGIGHTRWATHGRVTEANAHPHWDTSERFHIVLNGIVENWTELRDRLKAQGAEFTSETDAEVVAHLIASHFDGDLVEAVRLAYNDLRGHYAFVAMSADEPDVLVGARKECPLVVGLGDGESFIASAIPAFMSETRNVQLVHDGEIVAVTPTGSRFISPDGTAIEREVDRVDWNDEQAEKGGYETFMLKEIHEQADAVAETIAGRIGENGVELEDMGAIDDDYLRGVRRVVIVACGTSYHAGLVGRYAIEWWSRVPVEMDIASEFRYRNPVLDENDLVIGISQSGETADTLAAMRLARERGSKVLAITNIQGSQATRDSDGVLFTRAGLEIGVAATKTFVAQVAAMYLFALKMAQLRGTLEPDVVERLSTELRAMPHLIATLVENTDEHVRRIAEHWKDAGFFLYLGRHVGLSICLEGALKLKEVSYIPTDAYAAGEMKHGPIALLDERTPVVCVATDSPVLDKVLSNIAEVRARGAHVIAVATEGSGKVAEHAEEVVEVPRTDWLLQPLLAVIPLQLLAYYIARARGLNVDQPRNLAKTVTVE